jgi:cytochrome c-type biogenesis protein CcmH/NrfG
MFHFGPRGVYLRKLDEAAGAYRQAVKLEPDEVSHYRSLGRTLQELGKEG